MQATETGWKKHQQLWHRARLRIGIKKTIGDHSEHGLQRTNSTEEKSNQKWIKKLHRIRLGARKTVRQTDGERIREQEEKSEERKLKKKNNDIGLPYWRDRVITSSDPYLKDLSAPLNIFQLAIRPTPKALFNMLTYIYTMRHLLLPRMKCIFGAWVSTHTRRHTYTTNSHLSLALSFSFTLCLSQFLFGAQIRVRLSLLCVYTHTIYSWM